MNNQYDISYEIIVSFYQTLEQVAYLHVFEVLTSHFKTDLSRYEVKLILLQKLIPLMKKSQADAIMKVFETVLEETPPEESLFKMNINPVRVGLSFYKTVDDITSAFGYSQYCAAQMKNKLTEQMVQILDIYKEPPPPFSNIKLMMVHLQQISNDEMKFYEQKQREKSSRRA